MEAVHAHLEARLVALLADVLLHLLLDLLHDLLDAGGMDATVRDQALEGQARDLPAVGVIGGDEDRLRGVVHDEVDPGEALQGPDVPPLPADDSALHVVGRQVHDRDRGLHRVVRGEPLDGGGQHLLGLHVRRLAGFLLQAHGQQLRLPTGLDLGLRHHLPASLLGGEAGDGLELAPLLLQRGAEPGLLLGQHALPLGDRPVPGLHIGLPAVQLIEAAGELLLLLDDPALDLLDLTLTDPRLLVQVRPDPQRQLLRLELGGPHLRFRFPRLRVGVGARPLDQALGVVEDAGGARLGIAERASGRGARAEVAEQQRQDCNQRQEGQPRHGHRSLHPGTGPVRIVCTRGCVRQIAAKVDEL